MKNTEETRMAGDYEIIHSLHIGDKEVVFGECRDKPAAERYMCAYCETTDILRGYSECMASDDYLEIIQLYVERLDAQIEAVKSERSEVPYSIEPITADQCYKNDLSKSIEGKIIAVRADVLRHEYQTADHQILLVNGGFGASANSRGSAVFVTNLYSGKQYRIERRDVLGEIKPEHLPHWALEKASRIREREKKRIEMQR